MTIHVVVMGVAGCGKSAVGRRVAAALALPMVEGDDFHPPANVERMRQGVALTDADRAGWLAQLGDVLQQHPAGAVLSCSALKRAYRDTLRSAGVVSATTTEFGLNPARAEPLALKRILDCESMTELDLEARLSGLWSLLGTLRRRTPKSPPDEHVRPAELP